MTELSGRQRQAKAVRELWANPEYKAEMSKKISDGWKRRMAEIRANREPEPPKVEYHVPDLPGEVWKDVKGYEGMYAVSNLGRVKSLARDMPHKTYGSWHIKEKLLKPARTGYRKDHSDGYLYVSLHAGHNQQKPGHVHRLVAEAFVPKVEGKPIVNHKDCDRSNNKVDNLEWCTTLENTRHAMANNRMNWEHMKKPVVNVETGEIFESTVAAEIRYGVARSAISHAIKRNATSCGFHWKYAER